ncbi:BspA family leucine-rich repeat surface protein (plasmid) [Glaciihabitans sp. INWT7]|uniref:BspA family leucine-rich repeat surface protein n=1 Tax=Glaciihabitans sp. INWT7 TaxID=2596912 RepID=UPI00162A369C|nr:BspA family leucine-rich repeat surface protein [Glaciihabitans sp. INWT7]QNE48688.1 BspA family leucine-rich repeat surface protein [Glaciihabitans sp. INWT7]
MSRSLPTVRRHRRPRLADFRQALRSASGAIDLASIMVGVLVIGIIGGVIAVAVFAVIPWSQNEAAKSVLSSVKTAQSVAYVKGSDAVPHKGFMTATELTAAKLLPHSDALAVATDSAFNCFVAVSRSATGADYYSTDSQAEALPWDASISDATLGCTTDIRTQVGLLPISGGNQGGGALPATGNDGGTVADLTADGAPHTTAARMVSTWDTSIVNRNTTDFQGLSETCDTIVLPLRGDMNATINWGDGTSSTATEYASHAYTDTPGPKTITISGTFQSWGDWDYNWSAICITGVPVWGETQTQYLDNGFTRAQNIGVVREVPSTITSMNNAFGSNPEFNTPVKFFTGNVTDMSGMFYGDTIFNQPVSLNTSKATKMGSMFESAKAFNSPLTFTSTKNVVDMSSMFFNDSAFNQPVNFDTSSVTTLRSMFANAPAFNQPVNFDTKNVKIMDYMFYNAVVFNQPLDFSIAQSPTRTGMFQGAYAFNQDISGWH